MSIVFIGYFNDNEKMLIKREQKIILFQAMIKDFLF